MPQVADYMTRTRKTGAEDIILMRLHADRFRDHIPPHFTPPVDKRSRFQVALVAQSCEQSSYDSHDTGQTDEFHLWLQTASTGSGDSENGDTLILPSQHWLSLASASGNPSVRSYLQSFGFRPLILEKVDLHQKGGSVIFQDPGQIDWTIHGRGRGLERVGVEHVLNVKADGPDSAGHHIYASISDPAMDQTGRVHIQTKACEPFLHLGERFAAVIHRMPRLEANVHWLRKSENSFT